MTDTAKWLDQQAIAEVECLVPDLNGILRGKVVPATKLLSSPGDDAITPNIDMDAEFKTTSPERARINAVYQNRRPY